MQEIAYALLIALETAMRQGEILQLTLDNIYLSKRYVQLLKTKNGSARKIPLSRHAMQLLDLLKQSARRHKRLTLFNIKSAYADVLFRRVRDKLKIEDMHFHDTRHEAITRLARKLDVLDLARMTGHRDLRSLMVYYNATADELASRLDE